MTILDKSYIIIVTVKILLGYGDILMRFNVVFYDLPDGTIPVQEFLGTLDAKMRAKLVMEIRMLAENGIELREPYSKALGDGLFELRAKVGTDISRVIYFFLVGRKIVMTNGFIKKMQKTPLAEIEKARQYRAEYISRKE